MCDESVVKIIIVDYQHIYTKFTFDGKIQGLAHATLGYTISLQRSRPHMYYQLAIDNDGNLMG